MPAFCSPFPLAHPASWDSPFSHDSHSVVESSCSSMVPFCFEAAISCPDCLKKSLPQIPSAQPCAEKQGQDLSSPCPPTHMAIRVPQEVPTLLLPSQVSQGRWWVVLSGSPLPWTCLQPDSLAPPSQRESSSTQGRG